MKQGVSSGTTGIVAAVARTEVVACAIDGNRVVILRELHIHERKFPLLALMRAMSV
jgi:hypothetical protein